MNRVKDFIQVKRHERALGRPLDEQEKQGEVPVHGTNLFLNLPELNFPHDFIPTPVAQQRYVGYQQCNYDDKHEQSRQKFVFEYYKKLKTLTEHQEANPLHSEQSKFESILKSEGLLSDVELKSKMVMYETVQSTSKFEITDRELERSWQWQNKRISNRDKLIISCIGIDGMYAPDVIPVLEKHGFKLKKSRINEIFRFYMENDPNNFGYGSKMPISDFEYAKWFDDYTEEQWVNDSKIVDSIEIVPFEKKNETA